MNLERFDDAVAVGPLPRRVIAALDPAVRATPPAVANGFYTLTFPDGSHKTFCLHTQSAKSQFAPGRQVLGVLIGPENTSDYEGFAFAGDGRFEVWKRYRNTKLAKYADLLWMLATGCEADGYSLEVSRRCWLCNRPLTTPESLELGLGPECRKRVPAGWFASEKDDFGLNLPKD